MTNLFLVFKMSESDDSTQFQMLLPQNNDNLVNSFTNIESSDDSDIISVKPQIYKFLSPSKNRGNFNNIHSLSRHFLNNPS